VEHIAWYNGTRPHQRPWLGDPDEFETATDKKGITQVA